MKKEAQSKKEIYIILFSFLTVVLLAIASKFFGFHQMETIHKITTNIYEHPLKVSNASLTVKLDVYKIHRDMKDIVLSTSKKEYLRLIEEVNKHEESVYENLIIIEKNILGKDGLKLQKETFNLFHDWKSIRDEVITLVKNNKLSEAISITKGKGAKHVLKLENSSHKLYNYAKNKAENFKNEADITFDKLEFMNYETSVFILFLFLIIVYYTVGRISKYIYKNEHLNGVLSVIRDVNQLIVREKEIKTMLQESCNILTSNHVYGHAWVIIFNDNNDVDHILGSDSSENFKAFQEKIKNGWIPYCIDKEDEQFSYVENTNKSCIECPLKDLYESKGAFNIELKHENKLYGYLNISVEKKYILEDTELSLLYEVAGDIAYAIYNINIEQELEESYEMLHKLTENIPGAVYQYRLYPDGKSRFPYASKGIENVYEVSKKDVAQDASLVFKNLHLDDLNMVEASIKSSAQTMKEWNLEYRVNLPKRGIRWLHGKANPEKLEDGSVLWNGIINDITEQKNLYHLLQNAQSLAHLGSWEQNSDDNTLFWSDEVYHIFEIDNKENMTLNQFIDTVHPDDRSIVSTVFQKSIKEHIKYYLEHRLLFSDGRIKYVIERAEHFYDKNDQHIRTVGTVQDITNKQNYLKELEQKKQELETIIQEAPNPIMVHNEDGKVIIVNKVWKELTGYEDKEINTIDKWTFHAYGKKMPVLKEYIDKLYNLNQKTHEGEYDIITKDGNVIIWQFSSAPLGVIDGKRTVISSAMDITELKHKDEMLINQSRHAAMGEMIGMIAHQWRQPISTISMDANNMLLDIAIDNFSISASEEYANSISEQTQHLSQTIDDFRNFFKPDKVISKVNIKDILDQTLSIVQDSLKNNNIELKSSFETDSEVDAYPRELMQVFVNIITNAKDALVQNKIESSQINIKVYEDEKYINTEICDNGGGIDDYVLPKVFDPYFSTKDEKTGTGLGLYMSQMIIEKHLNGIIKVSNKDDGACFTVRLLKQTTL